MRTEIDNSLAISDEYYGGLLDHALHFGFSRNIQKGQVFYQPYLKVGNTKRHDVLTLIARRFGGRIHLGEEQGENYRNNNGYSFIIAEADEALTFLAEATPMLHFKKPQAQLFTEYYMLRRERIKLHKPDPHTRLAQDEEYVEEIQRIGQFSPTHINPITSQRIAGMLDIGGNIGISRSERGGAIVYWIFASMQTPNQQALQMMDSRYGTNSTRILRNRSDGQQTFSWQTKTTLAERVLVDLYPSLIHFRETAELSIVFFHLQKQLHDQYLHHRAEATAEAIMAGYSSAGDLREKVKAELYERIQHSLIQPQVQFEQR